MTICPTPSETITLGIENKVLEIDAKGELINEDSIIGKVMNHWVDKEGVIWIQAASNKELLKLDDYFLVKRKGEKIQPFFNSVNDEFKFLDDNWTKIIEIKKDKFGLHLLEG